MSDKDLDITLIVDSQELTKSRHRFYHVLGLYMTVNYKGAGKFEFPADLRLDFIRHHDVLEGYLDPHGTSEPVAERRGFENLRD